MKKAQTIFQTDPKFVVKNTGKYGLGVFANQNFKKGEIITAFKGEIITFAECIKRIKAGLENQTDSLQVGLEQDMDLDEFSRIFNHSCEPNAGLRKMSELIAIKNIKKGEEITYDYSATVGPNLPKSLWQMRCHCGSKNCRKILGNVLTIPRKQLTRYQLAGALQDYIIKELNIIKKLGGKLPKYKKISILLKY